MHIIIQHRITDPEKFFAMEPDEVLAAAPPGTQGRQFLVSKDSSSAVCLWESDSIDTLRGFMDGMTAEAADNSYYEVDTERSMGLPESAAAGA